MIATIALDFPSLQLSKMMQYDLKRNRMTCFFIENTHCLVPHMINSSRINPKDEEGFVYSHLPE